MTSQAEPHSFSRRYQKACDNIICDEVHNQLLSTLDNPIDQARLKAASAPHAGDWLHDTAPLSAVGLRLTNEDMRVAIGYRLGAAICQPHSCVCGVGWLVSV